MRQNYNLSACFQKSLERLRDRLEGLEGYVAGLEDGCSSISERLSAADSSMQQFTARAESLRQQRTQLGKHAEQVHVKPAFCFCFVLTNFYLLPFFRTVSIDPPISLPVHASHIGIAGLMSTPAPSN